MISIRRPRAAIIPTAPAAVPGLALTSPAFAMR